MFYEGCKIPSIRIQRKKRKLLSVERQSVGIGMVRLAFEIWLWFTIVQIGRLLILGTVASKHGKAGPSLLCSRNSKLPSMEGFMSKRVKSSRKSSGKSVMGFECQNKDRDTLHQAMIFSKWRFRKKVLAVCSTGWKLERRETEVPAGQLLRIFPAWHEKGLSYGRRGAFLLCWNKNTRVGILEVEDLFYGLYFSITKVLYKHPIWSKING